MSSEEKNENGTAAENPFDALRKAMVEASTKNEPNSDEICAVLGIPEFKKKWDDMREDWLKKALDCETYTMEHKLVAETATSLPEYAFLSIQLSKIHEKLATLDPMGRLMLAMAKKGPKRADVSIIRLG